MLRRIHEFRGYALGARDDEFGRVKDIYFDDHSWTIRYLVVDTGKWLSQRKVLISPHSVVSIREKDKAVDLNLTREQIENSPPIEHDMPVSRQFEADYYRYYNYPFYWHGAGMWGPATIPMVGAPEQTWPAEGPGKPPQGKGDPHLRSARDVTGYHIQARDKQIGHLEDFIFDDTHWAIDYLVVDTKNWLPGKKVLVSPDWVKNVDWQMSKVETILDSQTIETAPEYDPSQFITRDYEAQLFAHYGQRPYWEHRTAA